MMLTLAVSDYRSIRDLVLPLGRLNVITGGNGTGKSSLYGALGLLADVAQGRAIVSLAGKMACNRHFGRGRKSFRKP